MGLVRSRRRKVSKPYSAEELEKLKEKYTPSQLAAIQAGESAVSPDDLDSQAAPRYDPWSIRYVDDFAQHDPAMDLPIRAPHANTDPRSREKSSAEEDDEIWEWIDSSPGDEDFDPDAFREFSKTVRQTVGPPESEFNARSALAPTLFRPGETLRPKLEHQIAGDKTDKEKARPGDDDADVDPALLRVMQMTGYNLRQIASLRVKSLYFNQVTNQTRLGKINKQYVLTIAGNGNGLLGLGEGKSEEPDEARTQAYYKAIRNMQPILRYENRTIYGDVKGKVGATELELFTRPPGKYQPPSDQTERALHRDDTADLLPPAGFGLRCSAYIWEMCRAAGISDLSGRVTRARNPMNLIKATYEALMSQRHPDDVARARGLKMVDVRKVYYVGMV